MTSRSRTVGPFAALSALLVLGLLAAGCGEETTRPPGDGPLPAPITPDSLVSLFREALEDRDRDTYPLLIHPDFRFVFLPQDIADLGLPVDHLNRAEELTTSGNLLSGRPIEQPGGTVPGVSRIVIDLFDPQGDWETVTQGDFAGSRMRLYSLGMDVQRSGASTILIRGQVELYAAAATNLPGQKDEGEFWLLTGMVDLTDRGKAIEDATLGQLKTLYLTKEPPLAVLAFSPAEVTTDVVCRLDASGSSDPDGGLADEPFRFRIDRGTWTEWSSRPTLDHQFDSAGTHQAQLEVRDRWGLADTATVIIEVGQGTLPTSPDDLMGRFGQAYGSMDIEAYGGLLDAGFRFMFLDYDIRQLNLPSDHLDRTDDLASTANMFSGNPLETPDGTVPGVSRIDMYLDRATVWTPVTEGDFPLAVRALYNVLMMIQRPGASTIIVTGQTEFYAISSSPDDGGGTGKATWLLAGQVDLTDTGGGKTENSSWGSVKWLYLGSKRISRGSR